MIGVIAQPARCHMISEPESESSHLSFQRPGVKMTLADDKELLVMLSQQRHEERRTRYLWFLTIILAFTASQLCLLIMSVNSLQ